MTEQSTALVEQPRGREIRIVSDVIPVWDTSRFEHMQRIASTMAQMSLCPDGLCMTKDDDGKMVRLQPHTVIANCFMVVNQAAGWGMDPFAVAQCISIVHGKLCYEGKLVHAVIEAKIGVHLAYEFDEAKGDQLGVTVSGRLPGEVQNRTVFGTVALWRTANTNSPWSNPGNWKRQLRYRGAREWARAHAPGVLLGVYSDDEMEDLNERRGMVDITPQTARQEAPAFRRGVVLQNPNVAQPEAPVTPLSEKGGQPDAKPVAKIAAEIADEPVKTEQLKAKSADNPPTEPAKEADIQPGVQPFTEDEEKVWAKNLDETLAAADEKTLSCVGKLIDGAKAQLSIGGHQAARRSYWARQRELRSE